MILGFINYLDVMYYVQCYFNDCGEVDFVSINLNQFYYIGYIN